MRYVRLLLAVILFASTSIAQEKGYSIKVKIEGVKDTVCYLAGYYGPKQYYKDTADVDAQGNMIFAGDDSLPGGIYSVVLPDKKTYFEFIVTEQFFTLETIKGDQPTMTKNMKISGSKENASFYEYLGFIGGMQQKAGPWRKAVSDSLATDEKKKEAREKLNEIDKQVKEYKKKFMEEHSDLFVSKIFKTSEEPDVPGKADWPILPNGRKDSTFPRRYYVGHFWDGVDFSDERLIRTPVMHNKIEKFIKKVTVQHPDSICKAAFYLADKARANKEIFKYVVHYVTNTYEKSKIMGMDAVFVCMAEKYYLTGDAYWIDSTRMEKIKERARKLGNTLIGYKTPNVILQDTSETKWHNLYDVNAKYTVLYFWDSGCGHCKKETPKLKKLYDEMKGKNVEVFAVGTEFKNEEWKKYIREKELNWINISDNPEINKNAAKYLHLTTLESLNFRDTYDLYSTPKVFLLDEDKKIVAKQLSVEQLGEMLGNLLKKEEKKNESN
ncbi:MAG: DUF5106 domain-containing protein [Flavobacteriales bacterium]|nr:MAG: DUF5106 domain-containing protein [Flavobacteriales bacterium]